MTIAYVQSKSIATASALSVNVTLTSNVTAGNALIAGGYDGNGINQTDTVSDTVNAGNYANDNSVNLTTDGDTVGIFSKLNAGAGSTKITLTRSTTGGSLRLVAHEYSGLATSSALDQTATGHNTSSTSGTTSNVTTTQANELIFCVLGCAGADTVTSNSPFTQRENTGFPGGFASQDQVVSSTGTFAANYTISPADEYGAIIATYKAPGGGGGVTENLTEQTATFSEGTPSTGISYPLTGQSATSSEGTLGRNVSYALTAQTATFTEGALTPSWSGSAALTGQTATFTEGNPAAQAGYPLTAQSVTSSEGSLTGSLSAALTEQTATFTEGTITPQVQGDVTLALSALQAAFSMGQIGVAGLGAGRHRKWYGVRDGQQLLVFDSKVKADAARVALAERDAPKPKNRARKVKVREIPPPHEVLELPQIRRLAESQHETNTYHELLAAHSYTQLIQLHHDLKAQAQVRAQQAEEEEIAMILLHL